MLLVPILRLLTIMYFSVLSHTHAATAPAASFYSPPAADHADAFATRPGEARIHENVSNLEKRATLCPQRSFAFLSPPLSRSRGSARFLWSAQREGAEVAIIHRKI